MADFIFSLNATLPIFLIMVLGWFLMRIGLFTIFSSSNFRLSGYDYSCKE